MCFRHFASVVFVFGLLVAATPVFAAEPPPGPPASGGDSLPDTWSGLITLEWDSGIPDDSPLHQQVERVMMKYTKRWLMRVDFRVTHRGPVQVRYRPEWASVDFLQTSTTEGKNGAISTTEIWRIEAENRVLDGHLCNLELVVDSETQKYWIEVGGFEIPDAEKTGQIVISITDENGTRTHSEPINKETNVIEPVRFEGRYSNPWPRMLIGTFDAHVDPPPGVDITHATLGGTIAWQLYAGWSYLEDTAGSSSACLGCVPDIDDLRCRLDDFCYCLYVADASPEESRLVTIEDCLDHFCLWEPGTREFERAIDALRDCTDDWLQRNEE